MATSKTAKMPRVAIISGLRTPFARQATAYKTTSALDLARACVAELLARQEFDTDSIERVVYGQVLPSIEAPNIAREVVLGTGMDRKIDAYSVSRACATSFQSTVNIAEAIILGEIEVGLSGGADSSSVVPITLSKRLASTLLDLSKAKSVSQRLKLLRGLSLRDLAPVPPAVKEFTTGLSMGDSAEQMARDHGISREDQDAFAHRSHTLAAAAWAEGKLDDEVMAMHLPPYNEPFTKDNCVRANSTEEGYRKLRPAFDKQHGTVTAGNSSPLTDGAAALILMSEDRAKAEGITPLGYIKSWAFTAIDPRRDLLMGPAHASPIALKRAGLKLQDLDLFDMHEAFSAQILANVRALESDEFAKEHLNQASAVGKIDWDKFNVLGGSLSYGHPFAATGARMITQTLRELNRRGGGVALTAACAAGGLGVAMVLESE